MQIQHNTNERNEFTIRSMDGNRLYYSEDSIGEILYFSETAITICSWVFPSCTPCAIKRFTSVAPPGAAQSQAARLSLQSPQGHIKFSATWMTSARRACCSGDVIVCWGASFPPIKINPMTIIPSTPRTAAGIGIVIPLLPDFPEDFFCDCFGFLPFPFVAAPQDEQNFALAFSSLPHCVQYMIFLWFAVFIKSTGKMSSFLYFATFRQAQSDFLCGHPEPVEGCENALLRIIEERRHFLITPQYSPTLLRRHVLIEFSPPDPHRSPQLIRHLLRQCRHSRV